MLIIKIVICIYCCLHVMESKQISKIIVATCSQGLYGVIEYADSEYDIIKVLICIYCCLHANKSKQFSNIVVAICLHKLFGVIDYADLNILFSIIPYISLI